MFQLRIRNIFPTALFTWEDWVINKLDSDHVHDISTLSPSLWPSYCTKQIISKIEGAWRAWTFSKRHSCHLSMLCMLSDSSSIDQYQSRKFILHISDTGSNFFQSKCCLKESHACSRSIALTLKACSESSIKFSKRMTFSYCKWKEDACQLLSHCKSSRL